MQPRTQWTLAGTAVVLGWGAGIAGGAIALNDAEKPSTFGAAVTLEAKPRAGAGEVGLSHPKPTHAGGTELTKTPSATSRPAAPRAVPAAPPKRVAETRPAPIRAPIYDASADSANSAASAD